MSIFAISDLHLSFSTNKPMEIFHGWDNYVDRIQANWNRRIKNDDTVILPGDLSWALKLEDTLADFKFIDSLPGKKIILKGNHDLWWSTLNKMKDFFVQNEINTITPIFNSAEVAERFSVCGTRGWFYDAGEEKKIVNREAARLERSILAAENTKCEPLVFLHYPPVYGGQVCNEIMQVLKNHDIKRVFHGHIHGVGMNKSITEYDGVELNLISCDCIDFCPVEII